MKNTVLLIGILACTTQACKNSSEQDRQNGDSPQTNLQTKVESAYSQFIPVDSANKMVASYLTSIDYTNNDTDLQSLIISADQLEQYINQTPGDIAYFKLMLAHRLDYINAGNDGVYDGYNRNALTIVIAGYNNNGDAIYFDDGFVLDYSSPCPPGCPPDVAESPLLP